MNINFSQIIILVLIGAVALLIFGIRYLKNKENMALIAKNADLKSADDSSIILMLGIMFVALGAIYVIKYISFNHMLSRDDR
jgi:uncharacterized membrane protein YqiK